MNSELVTFEVQNEKIGIITLNRPEKMNALSNELMLTLETITQKISNNKKLKVVILKGNDKIFASGIDIKSIQNMSSIDAVTSEFINDSWFAIEKIRVPTIAAISGYSLGGGFELALMCDILIADKSAKFGFPEIKLGLMPGMGGTLKLQKLINPQTAFKKIILGEIFDADEALSYGLIDEISAPNAYEASLSLAKKISEMPIDSLIAIKKSFKNNEINPLNMNIERELFRSLFSSKGKEIGVKSFIEKKKPVFD